MDQDLKIPYQIFGESLASVTVITLRGFKVSSQQVQYSIYSSHILRGLLTQATSLFDHLKNGKTLRELELDGHVNISAVTDTVFTNVINTLSSVKFIGTVISNKQFTGLLTKVLNEGRTQLM